MYRILAGCLAASALYGQTVVSSSRVARFEKYFSPQKDDHMLSCEVHALPPHLSFGFRFQTGYVFHVPLKQYVGPGHSWRVLTRVTPEPGGSPVFLGAAFRLPNVPQNKQVIEWGGFYWIGEGRYSVDWLLVDDMFRVCRKHWTVEAKPTAGERALPVGIAPGSIQAVSFRRWSPQEDTAPDVPVLNRLTVLVHAAPLFPRMTRFRTQDRQVLFGSLASLLESVRAKSVRLVIFNLDQQRELFRREAFTPDTFDQAVQALDGLQLQLVNYKVLENRRGHVDLLGELFDQETHAQDMSDAVIVLGPPTRYADKVAAPVEDHPNGPRFFYIECRPFIGPDFPDSIEFAIKRFKGKKMVAHTPDEFAKAIQQIEIQLSPERRSGMP